MRVLDELSYGVNTLGITLISWMILILASMTIFIVATMHVKSNKAYNKHVLGFIPRQYMYAAVACLLVLPVVSMGTVSAKKHAQTKFESIVFFDNLGFESDPGGIIRITTGDLIDVKEKIKFEQVDNTFSGELVGYKKDARRVMYFFKAYGENMYFEGSIEQLLPYIREEDKKIIEKLQ